MCDAVCPHLIAGSIERLLAFLHAEHFCIQWLLRALTSHSAKQCASIRDQRDTPHFPILCAGRGIAPHNKLASVKIQVPPFDLVRLTLPAASKGKTFCQVRAVLRVAAV